MCAATRESSSTGITRRRFLSGAAVAGWAATAGIRCSSAPDTPVPLDDPFQFVVFNDTHVRDERCVGFLRKAVARIHELDREKPLDFAILCGDIVTAGRPREFELFEPVVEELGMPLYTTPGNHDFRGSDRSAYDRLFPGRVNYRFDHKGWTFIGFDSTEGSKWSKVSVPEATLDYLKRELKRIERDRPIVAFTHFPLGEGVTYRSTNAEEVLGLFGQHRLVHVFSGHFHGLTERTWQGTRLTTNRCLAVSRDNHDGSSERGFLLCTAARRELTWRFIEVTPGS